ncbi:uncharacterized protein AMSG_11860 [Thecamonas trahens ATCC 50062]|uniref:Amino acid transporter transmembrane domain-containing protein n=1 Tax=Thecamonas trahens ATCC 50062 TaxID=461836 RepID=A0A0L0DAF2_THETB|nr:hypothetical protein AMSG_11860 [Thecamonas trahens ATCC 50062]KNC49210.1 hypothetical protein AMSG_11860 [Thecamonas trahens ATCC 50062]|eukprot:XP_013758058.1 hypothetical protein AMSG_11860 [Thecamonas trahens ATCC 50062]
MIPLSLLRRISFLAHTSLVAVACMLYLTGMVVAHAITHGWDDSERGNINAVDLSHGRRLAYFNISPQIFVALPIIGFAFASHVQVPTVYEEMRKPTGRRMMFVAWLALITCAVVYLTVGIFGYITFGLSVDGNVFNNFVDEDNPYVGVAKLGLAITLMFSSPLFVHPMRENIVHLHYLVTTPREALAVTKPPLVEAMAWPIHASITIGLLGTTAFLGVLIPNVEVVLSFAGAVIVSILVYILPAAFYLGLRPATDPVWRKHAATALGLWGCVMLVVGTAVVITENV